MLNKKFCTYGVCTVVQIVRSIRPFIVRINVPFKDHVSANAVRRQLRELSNKIGPTLQPVFVSKKLKQGL